MRPVLALVRIASRTCCTTPSGTTISILILGTKSTTYALPRYTSDLPPVRPNPFTSVTVMPWTSTSLRAVLTSSSLNGLMMASIFFMATSYFPVLAQDGDSCGKARTSARALDRHAGRCNPRTFVEVEADRENDHRQAGVLQAALDDERGLVVEQPGDEGVLGENELAGDEEGPRILAYDLGRHPLGFAAALDARRSA